MRENIIENARFAPTRGKYKVFILDEVHMLSGSSFNALLKTLEEPPAHAIFILATTELYKIPATIASRCQRFEFHRVPPAVMIPRLVTIAAAEGAIVVEDVLAQIARLSEGCLRDAESLLGQVLALGEKNVTLEVASLVLPMTNLATVGSIVEAVSMNDARKAIDILDTFVADGGSVKHLVEELLEYVRTVMFAAFGDTTMDAYDPKTIERIRTAGSAFGVARSRAFLEALLIARTRQSLPALPQIPLEIAILDACNSTSSHFVPSIAPILPAAPITPIPVAVSRQEVAAPSAPIEYVPIVETSEPSVAPVRYDFSAPSASSVAQLAQG
ncbi:MAG: AAA family ATPase, partial [Methylococcaceae bacterium]